MPQNRADDRQQIALAFLNEADRLVFVAVPSHFPAKREQEPQAGDEQIGGNPEIAGQGIERVAAGVDHLDRAIRFGGARCQVAGRRLSKLVSTESAFSEFR